MFWYCCTHVGAEGDELLLLFQTVMCSAAGRCKVGVEGLMEGRRFAWASEDSEMQNSPWPSQNRRVEEFWLILDVHVVSVGASDGGWDGRWLLVQFVVLLAFVYDLLLNWLGLFDWIFHHVATPLANASAPELVVLIFIVFYIFFITCRVYFDMWFQALCVLMFEVHVDLGVFILFDYFLIFFRSYSSMYVSYS